MDLSFHNDSLDFFGGQEGFFVASQRRSLEACFIYGCAIPVWVEKKQPERFYLKPVSCILPQC